MRVRDQMKAMSRRIRSQEGQTLTEFAIIAPVIVGVLIFAIFFYEMTQIKLKQQEAERYVAWEFTGKLLTDYGQNGNQGSLFTQAKNDIIADTNERFDNLVSTNKLQNQRQYVMAEWELRDAHVTNNKVPEVPGGFWANLVFSVFKIAFTIWDMQSYWDSAKNPVLLGLMAGSNSQPNFMGSGGIAEQFGPSSWKFNQNGFIKVKMKWRVAPTAMFTKKLMDDRFNKAFRPFGTKTLNDQASPDGIALVVDSWNLQDGASISGKYQADKGTKYWKQVDRMAFVTPASKGIAKAAALLVTVPASIVSGMCGQFAGMPTIDPMETALAAKAYGPSQLGQRTLEGMSDSPSKFDTLPYVSAYKAAYDQRGEYFMGCKQQAVLGCNRSTSTDNPFGEFIITGE
jgi:hypothetical protein